MRHSILVSLHGIHSLGKVYQFHASLILVWNTLSQTEFNNPVKGRGLQVVVCLR